MRKSKDFYIAIHTLALTEVKRAKNQEKDLTCVQNEHRAYFFLLCIVLRGSSFISIIPVQVPFIAVFNPYLYSQRILTVC
jgi:hypothetical protein